MPFRTRRNGLLRALPGVTDLNIPDGVLRTLGDVDADPGILFFQRQVAQAETEGLDIVIGLMRSSDAPAG